jgi:hypothetical protein
MSYGDFTFDGLFRLFGLNCRQERLFRDISGIEPDFLSDVAKILGIFVSIMKGDARA